jgi:GT2 family glycosyltransferase
VERDSDGLQIKTLVEDNHSSDGSPEMAENEFPRIRVLRSTVNFDLCAANDLAIQGPEDAT